MPNLLPLFFFAIAWVYAAAGFGGGSSYIAVLALLGFAPAVIKSTALLCNVVVVAGGSYLFWRGGALDFRKIWPLVAASVPAAFIGAQLPISEKTFFLCLGASLVLAALLLIFQEKIERKISVTPRREDAKGSKSSLCAFPSLRDTRVQNALLGGGIGFLSGMVGIGGGIFLAPVLHFLRWDEGRKIAATASFFILANSISGLAGLLSSGTNSVDWHLVLPLLIAVFVGGQLGSRAAVFRFNGLIIRQITGWLVLLAGGQILWKYLGVVS